MMSFPHYNDYIESIARQSLESQRLLKELDEELGKNQKLLAIKDELRRTVEHLELDAYILNDIANEQKGQTLLREGEERKAMQCYESLMELKNLIKHLDLGKIIMCDLLKKHIELVNDWRFKETIFKKKFEQCLAMESRPEVSELRAFLSEKKQLEKELEYAKQETLQCTQMCNNKINKNIAKRNNIIVELVKGRKELIEQRQMQKEKGQKCIANVDKSLMKSFENFFDVNLLFSNYGVSRPISHGEISTVTPRRSILCVPGVNNNDGGIKKQVHFKPNLESVAFIQESPTETFNCDVDKGKNPIMATFPAENVVETRRQQFNHQSEQNISIKDLDAMDIESEVQSSSSSSDSISDTIETLPPQPQNSKPKILENILIKPAIKPATNNGLHLDDSSPLKDDSLFKIPMVLRSYVSPADSSIESCNDSTLESNCEKDSLTFYSELIKNPQEKVTELEINSYDGNREPDSSPTNWNFHVATASNDFFFDTTINNQKTDNNSYL